MPLSRGHHIREPRPADWGDGMTVCIAATIFEKGIIGVSDTMVSMSDMSGDERALKYQALGWSWMTMFAGNDISPATPILQSVQSRLESDRDEKLESIATYFIDAYRFQLNQKAETEVLGPLGMSLEEFRSKGLKQLGPDVFNRLLYQIQNIQFSLDFLTFGYDGQGTPHIFTVTNPGVANYYDFNGFWAIGSGQTSALGHLFNLKTPIKYHDLSNAMYCVLDAKFHAECAPGVGPGTRMTILMPNRQRFALTPSNMREIKASWIASRVPDVPSEIVPRLVKLLEDAKLGASPSPMQPSSEKSDPLP
jgi:hypothetical protein